MEGIEIIGLLGVIVTAQKEKVVENGLSVIEELRSNGFRVSEKILEIVKAKLQNSGSKT